MAIYVSTDLELDPIKVIELYAVRFSIEETFRELKQRLFGFAYHFWCKSLPKLNRFAKAGDISNMHEVNSY
jgi:IS4 transposase